MKYFGYPQNNSGGSWVGPYHHVIIEAANAKQADLRAETETDVYFDGCMSGSDCDCCGDRWSRAWDDGDDVPVIYDTPVAEYDDEYFGGKILVLHFDGTEEIFGRDWGRRK